MSTDTVAAWSTFAAALIAMVAAVIALWQAQLARQQSRIAIHAIEAQGFTTILQWAVDIKLSETIDFISTLSYNDYNTYKIRVSEEQQRRVRNVVDFFNDLSHLMQNGYVNDQSPIRIYGIGLRTCEEKLLTPSCWWLNGIRADRRDKNLYENFERLCCYAQYWLGCVKKRGVKDSVVIQGYKDYLNSHINDSCLCTKKALSDNLANYHSLHMKRGNVFERMCLCWRVNGFCWAYAAP